MSEPMVSVIIPAYNQGAYIGRAIQSVLDQTFDDFELIVINDGATDNTAEVIDGFTDDRLHHLKQENRGLPAARNTGLAAARGRTVCFLDSDDAYLPAKLETQLAHLAQRPEIDVSYGANIEIDADDSPTWLSRAPESVGIVDLLYGFPFNINDVMIKREWISRINGFDESYVMHGEDRPFYTDLALAGAKFSGVNEFLTYRRLHRGRVYNNIPARLELMHKALRRVFDDPRCPDDARLHEFPAIANLYLGWSTLAYLQGEEGIGQAYLLEAVRLNPELAQNDGENIRRQVVWTNVRAGDDHEVTMRHFFRQLPDSLAELRRWENWCLGFGHVLLGFSDTLWGHDDSAKAHFREAEARRFKPDRAVLNRFVDELLSLSKLRGQAESQRALADLISPLQRLAGRSAARYVRGQVAFNMALENRRKGDRAGAFKEMATAITLRPSYLANRGALSILGRGG